MKVNFFKQSKINLHYKKTLNTAIDSLINGDKSIVLGQYSRSFEIDFAKYLGVKEFVFTSNGLDSLILALKVLDLPSNCEVIVPCHSYIASWLAPLHFGFKLIVAPVRNDNFLIDVSKLETLLTPNTKCIIPVHLYGNSCDMIKLDKFAKKHGLFLIDDAAQAHGIFLNDRSIGSYGHMTCFSFYPTKNLGALGEAGGISTNSTKYADRLRCIRNYGRSTEHNFINTYPGMNSRGDEIQSAFLISKLKNLDSINIKRRSLIYQYKKFFNNELSEFCRLIDYSSNSAPHLAILEIFDHTKRDNLIKFLFEKDIETAIHYRVPCHQQPCIKPTQISSNYKFLNQAFAISNSIISLPMSEVHTYEEINYICNSIDSFFTSS